MDVFNFFCPNCGRKTKIQKNIDPFGKKKKCKGCAHIFSLCGDTMRIQKSQIKNPFASTQIKSPPQKTNINPLNTTQLKPVLGRNNIPNIKLATRKINNQFNATQFKRPAPQKNQFNATQIKGLMSQDNSNKKQDASFSKKIVITCPYCQKNYRVRASASHSYACTQTGEIFSINDVSSMKIIDSNQDIDKTRVDLAMQDTNQQKTTTLENTSKKYKNKISREVTIEMSKLPKNNTQESNLSDLITKNKQEIANKYQLLGEVATSRFGKINMAFDKVRHQYLAITFNITATPKEIEKIAKLHHPNTIRIYDFGFHEKQFYVAMEFIQGVNIKEYVHWLTKQKISFDDAIIKICQRFCELCEVVAYLHKQNLYHSDINPQNIMISNSGDIKLIYFGKSGDFAYKYAAPEKFTGSPTNSKTDIYSMGAVLFELLTGSSPNKGANEFEIIYNSVADNQFPAKSNIDKKLQNICLSCIAIDEKRRYNSIQDLRLDLMDYVSEKQKISSIPHIYLASSKIMLPLVKRKNYIGRALSNDIIIDSENVSRIHAIIHVGKQVIIENISKNYPIVVSQDRLLPGKSKTLTEEIQISISGFKFTFVPKQQQKKVLQTNEQNHTIQRSIEDGPILMKEDNLSNFFHQTQDGGWEIGGDE